MESLGQKHALTLGTVQCTVLQTQSLNILTHLYDDVYGQMYDPVDRSFYDSCMFNLQQMSKRFQIISLSFSSLHNLQSLYCSSPKVCITSQQETFIQNQ